MEITTTINIWQVLFMVIVVFIVYYIYY